MEKLFNENHTVTLFSIVKFPLDYTKITFNKFLNAFLKITLFCIIFYYQMIQKNSMGSNITNVAVACDSILFKVQNSSLKNI